MVHYSYRQRALAALDSKSLSENTDDVSLAQIHARVRAMGDKINSPAGPRRVTSVKQSLADFEDDGIVFRDGNQYRLTPHLQRVLDDARVEYKCPVNATPRRQMQLYRKILTVLAEQTDIPFERINLARLNTMSKPRLIKLIHEASEIIKRYSNRETADRGCSPMPTHVERAQSPADQSVLGGYDAFLDGMADDDDNEVTMDFIGDESFPIIDVIPSTPLAPRIPMQRRFSGQLTPPLTPEQGTASLQSDYTVVNSVPVLASTPSAKSHMTAYLPTHESDMTLVDHDAFVVKDEELSQLRLELLAERKKAALMLEAQATAHMLAMQSKNTEAIVHEQKIQELDNRIIDLRNELDEVRTEKELFDADHMVDRQRIAELDARIAEINNEGFQRHTELESAKGQITRLTAELEHSRAEVLVLEGKVLQLTKELEKMHEKDERNKRRSLDAYLQLAKQWDVEN